MPSVRGRSASDEKFLMVCGCLSSRMPQSFFVSVETRPLCLSRTVKKRLTRFTFTLRVAAGASSVSGVSGTVLTGGASGEGADCAWAWEVKTKGARRSRNAGTASKRRRRGIDTLIDGLRGGKVYMEDQSGDVVNASPKTRI